MSLNIFLTEIHLRQRTHPKQSTQNIQDGNNYIVSFGAIFMFIVCVLVNLQHQRTVSMQAKQKFKVKQ